MARAVGHFNWSLELHRKLLADHVRNRAFQQALHAFVRPGAISIKITSNMNFLILLPPARSDSFRYWCWDWCAVTSSVSSSFSTLFRTSQFHGI